MEGEDKMFAEETLDIHDVVSQVESLVSDRNLVELDLLIAKLSDDQLLDLFNRLHANPSAVVYRLLPKMRALEIFEALELGSQALLVHNLQDSEVARIFAELDPDDRVWLLDELPSKVAPRLLRGLDARERRMTAEVLGYPKDSVGRRMTPEFLTTSRHLTVEQTLTKIRRFADQAETIYTIPVTDSSRRLVGVAKLHDLVIADPSTIIEDIMQEVPVAFATDDAEDAARRCLERDTDVLPIVDSENRIVGILTIDDAARIIERETTEDTARQGGVEPLNRPYLGTRPWTLVRSRVVWLCVLAVGATLTVTVLSSFEATLQELTVLALFVPLLIGTGGNTGNQAATTVTRSLALGEVTTADVWRVLRREVRVGFSLGLLLGTLGFGITTIIYGAQIGAVIGLTLLAICTVAASVGGVMPMIAKKVRVDPAVFSNPFITTFVDAVGLLIYFGIAIAILQP